MIHPVSYSRPWRSPVSGLTGLILSLLVMPSGQGGEPVNTQDYIRDLSLVNIHSPLEPSWPHTGRNLILGTSLSTFRLPSETPGEAPKRPGPSSFIRQEWSLIRSLFYPLDAGISYAHFYGASGQTPWQLSGWLQWTPWEAFGWPVLAFRASYSRLRSFNSMNLNSGGAGAQLSWGYSRLSVWGGAQFTHHLFEKTRADQQDQGSITPEKHTFQTMSQTLGLHIQIIPNLFSMTLEKLTHKSNERYSVKAGCIL